MKIKITKLSNKQISTIKHAARKLYGAKRREFQAQVAIDYMDSNARLAEKTFGWSRNTVILGLHEKRTGIVCVDNFKARGNKKSEEKNKQLEIDICCLAEPESQTDPKFRNRSAPPQPDLCQVQGYPNDLAICEDKSSPCPS
ncbi:hypothetical protein CCP4SC76_3380001 [Gammaproteobacteria bacterium]